MLCRLASFALFIREYKKDGIKKSKYRYNDIVKAP
jgi:hypothetical protein